MTMMISNRMGYRRFYNYNSPEKKAHLNKWVMEKLQNPRLWFRFETNPMIRVLKQMSREIILWLQENTGEKSSTNHGKHRSMGTKPNEDYSSLNNRFTQVSGQFARYLGHVSKYIGGVKETPKMVEQKELSTNWFLNQSKRNFEIFIRKCIYHSKLVVKTSVLTK